MVAIIRLFFIHFSAALAIWLSTYIVGLDILLSLIYILIISFEISSLKKQKVPTKLMAGTLWIGIPLTLSILTSLKLSNITIFILEFWYTPILPIISFKPYIFSSGFPLYYYILIWLPAILFIHFYLLTKKRNII
ncbi:MAG TPA: hypothetical protein VFC73_04310 [Syntrophomonadaceae bacterium]|nr:hypothetical protein [Syntrophomonadaceae bacterium]